ncbi:MAG: hypothetical protein ACXWZM_09640 [Solirubrobacterales bacterium]
MLVLVTSLSISALALPASAAAAPANDAFASAQQLTGASTSATGTTVEATLEMGEPPHFAGDGSVWYSWTAPLDSNVRVNTCTSEHPTRIQAYTGSSLASLSEQETTSRLPQCANGADSSSFHAKAGTTYRIVVVEYAEKGSFTLSLSAPPAPANDDFADAEPIGSLPVRIAATTADTTVEPDEEGYFGSLDDAQSVWYRWTASKDMRVWHDECGPDFGTDTRIYRGNSLGSLTPVNDQTAVTAEGQPRCDRLYASNAGSGNVSSFMAKAGTTYRIQVLLENLGYDPDFHLGLREARFDGAISQTVSSKSIRRGKALTYKVTVRNLGTLPMSPEIALLTSKPHKLARPVVGTRYLSLDPSQGRCRKVRFFAVHPGAICAPGRIAPGKTVRIVARVRPSGSLSHWVEIDYLHGGQGDNDDDNPRNNRLGALTTIVRSPRR